MSEREKEQNQFNAMVLVPKQLLERVHQTQERILTALEELPTAQECSVGSFSSHSLLRSDHSPPNGLCISRGTRLARPLASSTNLISSVARSPAA